jgi:starch-binding outer membrane protein, SusD/RagB family
MKFNIITIILVTVIGTLSSCEKFLEESPSKTSSLVVTTTAQLDALLNNYSSTFYKEGNRTAIYSTDDFGLTTDLYNARPGTFSSMATIQFMLWDIEYLPQDTREGFWSGEYKKIFNANMVLDFRIRG